MTFQNLRGLPQELKPAPRSISPEHTKVLQYSKWTNILDFLRTMQRAINSRRTRPVLPTEIWIDIIQYIASLNDLTNLSLVNHGFKAIANPLMWNALRCTVDLDHENRQRSKLQLRPSSEIERRGFHVKKFELKLNSDHDKDSSWEIGRVLGALPHLEQLNLPMPQTAIALGIKPTLKTLCFTGPLWPHASFDPVHLRQMILEVQPEKLQLVEFYNIYDIRIKSLDLGESSLRITNLRIDQMTLAMVDVLNDLIKACSHLRIFTITFDRSRPRGSYLEARCAHASLTKALTLHSTTLKELHLFRDKGQAETTTPMQIGALPPLLNLSSLTRVTRMTIPSYPHITAFRSFEELKGIPTSVQVLQIQDTSWRCSGQCSNDSEETLSAHVNNVLFDADKKVIKMLKEAISCGTLPGLRKVAWWINDLDACQRNIDLERKLPFSAADMETLEKTKCEFETLGVQFNVIVADQFHQTSMGDVEDGREWKLGCTLKCGDSP